MDIITSLLLFFGISILLLGLLLFGISILLLYSAYKLITKKPALAIFLIILVLVLSTVELLDPVTIALGITGWIASILLILKEYKKLKLGIKI